MDDYVVVYAALVVMLALAITLSGIPSPRSNVPEFLAQLAVAARAPGTVLRVRVFLPESVRVEASGHSLTLRGEVIPKSIDRLYRGLGLGNATDSTLHTSFQLGGFRLDGGYVYVIRVASSPGRVDVEVLEARRIPHRF